MKKIVFTGGGTFGHAMPNVYLIEQFEKSAKEYQCFYIGSTGIEKRLVESKVKQYYSIPAVKLIRGKFFANLKIPFVLISAISKAKKALKQIKPDVVFSKGGYVALPVCIAAKMLKIPAIAHESDYSFGLANKIILKTCTKMCVNFEHLTAKSKKVVYTGPIFGTKYENQTTKIKDGQVVENQTIHLNPNLPTMLVVGGSLGAVGLNKLVCAAAKDLQAKFNIVHITGKGNKNLPSFGNYNAIEIMADMNSLYNTVDFVVGRAGAGVTAECYFKKLPMILVPLENKASRGDQVQNAQYYVAQGVAELQHEADLTPTKLQQVIENFYHDFVKYKHNYDKQKQINGKEMIVDIIKTTIE